MASRADLDRAAAAAICARRMAEPPAPASSGEKSRDDEPTSSDLRSALQSKGASVLGEMGVESTMWGKRRTRGRRQRPGGASRACRPKSQTEKQLLDSSWQEAVEAVEAAEESSAMTLGLEPVSEVRVERLERRASRAAAKAGGACRGSSSGDDAAAKDHPSCLMPAKVWLPEPIHATSLGAYDPVTLPLPRFSFDDAQCAGASLEGLKPHWGLLDEAGGAGMMWSQDLCGASATTGSLGYGPSADNSSVTSGDSGKASDTGHDDLGTEFMYAVPSTYEGTGLLWR